MKGALGCLTSIGWLLLGLLQIVAVSDGIQHWLNWPSFACWLLALFVGGWPIVGTALGMIGAHFAWGWSWFSAFLLFWGLALAIFTVTVLGVGVGVGAIVDRFRRRRDPIE